MQDIKSKEHRVNVEVVLMANVETGSMWKRKLLIYS